MLKACREVQCKVDQHSIYIELIKLIIMRRRGSLLFQNINPLSIGPFAETAIECNLIESWGQLGAVFSAVQEVADDSTGESIAFGRLHFATKLDKQYIKPNTYKSRPSRTYLTFITVKDHRHALHVEARRYNALETRLKPFVEAIKMLGWYRAYVDG